MQLIKPKSARKESACVACSAARKQRVSDNMNASSAPRGRCEGERWPGTQRLRDRPRYTHNAPSLTSGLSSHWVFSKVGLLQAPSQPINPLCRSSTPSDQLTPYSKWSRESQDLPRFFITGLDKCFFRLHDVEDCVELNFIRGFSTAAQHGMGR